MPIDYLEWKGMDYKMKINLDKLIGKHVLLKNHKWYKHPQEAYVVGKCFYNDWFPYVIELKPHANENLNNEHIFLCSQDGQSNERANEDLYIIGELK